MSNYFYTDANGQKQGPINDQQLQILATQGIIKPESPLETEEGQQIVAGLISGLAFPEATPSESRPDEANPFTGSVIQDVPVPKVSKLKNLAARIGIVSAALLLLIGGALWISPTLRFILIYGTDVKAVDEEGLTLLHRAAYNENIGVTKFLISKGADVNAKDNFGQTPLHRATSVNPNIEILKFLISEGADVNAKDDNGWTPLHKAVTLGTYSKNLTIEICKLLISKGADVNTKDNFGQTPLHSVAKLMSIPHSFNSRVENAEFLISHGADINAKDNKGRTPLHQAVTSRKDSVEAVMFFASEGAEINARDNDGHTPLDYAKTIRNTAVVNFLSELE